MEAILLLSNISIMVTLFLVLVFVGGLPALMVFKNVGNEKIASSLGVVLAIIILQTTFSSYIASLGDMKLFGVITIIVFFVVLVIPFVAYGFPDFTFPGRIFLIGGLICSILTFFNISILSLDFSKIFYNHIIQYVSCAWGAWNIIAFISNPMRRNRVFKNIFKGEIQAYVEGDFR